LTIVSPPISSAMRRASSGVRATPPLDGDLELLQQSLP